MACVDQVELDSVQQSLALLCEQQQTLLLSTLSEGLEPCLSYAPYWRDSQGVFYIFISELAEHTMQLQHNSQASVMLIRDEAGSRNLFARERAIWRCKGEAVPRESECFTRCLGQLEARQGGTVSLLRTLQDFMLFALVPIAGRYVRGFGRAYDIDLSSGQLLHVSAERLQGRK